MRYFIILFIIPFIFNSCKNSSDKFDNIIEIKGLNCTMNCYNWHYTNNPILISKLNSKYKQSNSNIEFLIFQHPNNSKFNRNNHIMLIVSDLSGYPNVNSLEDELRESKKDAINFGRKLNNIEFKNINGVDALIFESAFINNNIDYINFYMVIIDNINKKDYNFYCKVPRDEFTSLKPEIEKIYYSIKRKS